ncbi:microtubule associated protein-domain-containing protein [Absidia repens]|uniref:Microtubule associated protein-domain-containing protein n=1 Tax=Absidia repens TaxID=90262 RepID=A0A1X2HKM0_9FUNG|nr:microtubule associated protein-domain-containing protein [Absidia repens]
MERLQLKAARLETLWSCLGTCVDPVSVGDKLKYVLFELDKVIEHEEWRKQVLSADIEDIMADIECGCQILGISMESLLSSNMDQAEMIGNHEWEFFTSKCVMAPTSERKNTLTMLNNKLANEIRQRRLHIKEWLADIDALCLELGLPYPFDSYSSYHDNLCWATVQKISCTLRDLTQKQTTNKGRFEQLVHSIHYYQTVLGESINNDSAIDIALHKLCNNVTLNSPFDMYQHPKNDSECTNNDHCNVLYYRHPLPFPLSLQDDFMATLQTKVHDLQALYDTRMALFNLLSNNIATLWNELKVPEEKQCTIFASLHKDDLNKLQQNFDEMKTIVRTMTDEYIDTIRDDLTRLWDACLLTQIERDEFLSSLYHKANTMDTVHLIIDKHMNYLEHIQSSSYIVSTIMKERKELIQKMIRFETSASDPKRLFQASFQLMEEERWRKTCFPTLLQLDDALIKAVQEFESISDKYFMVGNTRYLDMLRDEIADRTTNQTFFGFLNTEHNHDRLIRSKSRPSALSFNTPPGSSIKRAPKTPSSLSESPTQDAPPTNDIQPQTRHGSKRRPSPVSNKSTNTKDASIISIDTSSPLLPSSSTSSKRMQTSPSLSTRPKKIHDIKKRLSNQSISTQQITIIPQQYKSKSYPVSSSNKDTIEKDSSIPTQLSLGNNKKRQPILSDGVIEQRSHQPPPVSPVSLSLPRSKASQIPIRAHISSNRSPSSLTTTAEQQQHQQQQRQQEHQQQLTVQCV